MPAVASGCARPSTGLGAVDRAAAAYPAYGRMGGLVRPHARGGAVTDLPAPTATRLTRARWLDARLLIGLLLVLLSVVVGAKVVADADQRVQVWSVTRDLGADTPLTGDDLQAASVNLDDATGRYLAAVRGPRRPGPHPPGRARRAAARSPRSVARTRPSGGGSSSRSTEFGVAGLDKGQVVDVYAVPETPQRRAAGPARAGAGRRDDRRGREVRRQRVRRQRVQGRRQPARRQRGRARPDRRGRARRRLPGAGAGRRGARGLGP